MDSGMLLHGLCLRIRCEVGKEMKHDVIFYYFENTMKEFANGIDRWFPNGQNSIRVRLTNGSEYIFTYHNSHDWCFETLDSYILRMKGELTMRC